MFGLFERKKTYQDLPAPAFEKQITENKGSTILDVRSSGEFKAGHIPGAINVNVMDDASFAKKISGLDKSKTYYVYCRSGGRSGQACSLLAGQGFTHVFNLAGGLSGWQGPVAR